MEITSFGETCLRLKGKEGVVAADAFPRIVGPTGRGLTADILTFSHPDGQSTLGLEAPAATQRADKTTTAKAASSKNGMRIPTSLESAFLLDSPGEYDVHEILVTGVRTFRDEAQGAERGFNTCFVYELDGVHIVHLGDVGHLLTEDELGDVGTVEVVCVPIGGSLAAAKAAELVAQLDAHLIVPMPIDAEGNGKAELDRFLHEMSVEHPEAVPKLAVTASSVPSETTVVLLEPRGRN
jgi:L-ascorbate metabolism protein UlaG (beta-lactamase superfamily)